MAAHPYNSRTWEVDVEGSKVQGYMRPSLKAKHENHVWAFCCFEGHFHFSLPLRKKDKLLVLQRDVNNTFLFSSLCQCPVPLWGRNCISREVCTRFLEAFHPDHFQFSMYFPLFWALTFPGPSTWSSLLSHYSSCLKKNKGDIHIFPL